MSSFKTKLFDKRKVSAFLPEKPAQEREGMQIFRQRRDIQLKEANWNGLIVCIIKNFGIGKQMR